MYSDTQIQSASGRLGEASLPAQWSLVWAVLDPAGV